MSIVYLRWISCIFLVAFLQIGYGQCPEGKGTLLLATQTEIDSFLTIYPNCTNYRQEFRWANGKRIYWDYEDTRSYIITLFGLLISLLIALHFLFKKLKL